MVFSSILFLFRFLPAAFLLYYFCPPKLRNGLLLLLSLVFYSWGEVRYFPIMIASTLVDYIAGQGIKHFGKRPAARKGFLVMSVVFNLGMLFFFKYTNFFLQNLNALAGTAFPLQDITLPLGISFYTFQTMSYTIDVYRGDVEAEDNIINFAAFVVLFPQLIAGPIVRYTDISRELKERTITLPMVEEGIAVFIRGLGRKVLIANNCGALWTQVESLGFGDISSPLAWLGILAFTIQIYFDFSGYSLMAIGLGKMLGFQFPQNFNDPYVSKSATEFWRRWHMTLGSWFREYVYIPLGGNRCSPMRNVFNIFVVWFLTGLWHGASWNFVLWGLSFFVLLVIEKNGLLPVLNRHPILSRCYMIPVILLSWSLFAITDFGQLGVFLGRLFSFTGGADWLYYLRNYAVVLGIGILFSTPLVAKGGDWLARKTGSRLPRVAGLTVVLVLSVAYLVDATYNPFLYFRF